MTKGKGVSETGYNNANSDFREKHAGAKRIRIQGLTAKRA